MDKTTQNLAWSVLQKEFKEEVKKEYKLCSDGYRVVSAILEKLELRGCYRELEDLFGHHNLTSDAEGDDEMLTVSRKQIDALQGEIFKAIMDAHDADDWQDAAHYILDVMPRSFAALFGSKCLSDEDAHEDNFAKSEPKFKVGDKVRLKDVYEIDEVDEDMERVSLKGCTHMEDFDNLEHYTEPTHHTLRLCFMLKFEKI